MSLTAGWRAATLRSKEAANGLLDFLARGGEMGALLRAFDWSSIPLGPIERRSQRLGTKHPWALPRIGSRASSRSGCARFPSCKACAWLRSPITARPRIISARVHPASTIISSSPSNLPR